MKIKFTLLTVLISMSSLYSYSQTLSNTTWAVYNPYKTFFAYFHFGTDTLSYSYDNVSYTPFTAFGENGNNISFVDLPSRSNATKDVGNYTFSIQNDSLKFILINDVMDSRKGTLTMCYWVSSKVTGINTPDFTTSIKFYPNPLVSTTTLQFNKSINNATLTFYNSVGHLVKQIKNITGQTFTVNRDNLPCGVYFTRLTLDNKTINTEKLIIMDYK